MSVQVSNIKQFVFLLLLFLIFLIVLEVLVNIWLYNFYRCDFEDNEMFNEIDPGIKRKICLESLAYDFTKEKLTATHDKNLVYINSQGFRGPEFEQLKSQDTIRIFIMGGSTTFGIGVLDNQTFPYYLQKYFDNSGLNFNVEIINSGLAGLFSKKEVKLIKERWLNFEPDIFIVYDGFNEMFQQLERNPHLASPKKWKERWMEICDLGKLYGYDTIILLQPFPKSGRKILTEQEYVEYTKWENRISGPLKYPELYPQYAEQLGELKNHCTLSADLRGLFDNFHEPIFYDYAHTGPRGNQIIAEKIFQISLPFVKEKFTPNDTTSPSLEIESTLISNDTDLAFEEFYFTIRDVISFYKTPSVLQRIFEQ